MSHQHTHGPGESHSHSHSHGPQQPQPQQQPQQVALPPTDPALQAMIEADFRPVSLIVNAETPAVLCEAHKLDKCEECGQDYVHLNRLAKILASNPSLAAPPPANVVSRNLSQAVNNTKEEGNVCCPVSRIPLRCLNFLPYSRTFTNKRSTHSPSLATRWLLQ